ncbi:hypothetical protein PMPD1_3168 [Paramixta manurensis]|uniref:Topoisomerase II n=1 Tax=Paramixta manurensis TaxID=2740817 RepID=A0A6M8UBQ7_9GAMM|nr:hypothetical protein PMPD1_3168 [Erwiniaceae bacterium PD-1]
MNSQTVLPSFLAALILLLLAVVLVKKYRFNRLLALLLVVLPVILGNLYYLRMVLPQQREQALLNQARARLASEPPWRTIKQQEPALYKQLDDELMAEVRDGVPISAAMGHLRGMLVNLLNQRIGRAGDQSIDDYIRLSVEEMATLRAKDPQLCFKFLFPQVSGGVNMSEVLPVALQQRDLRQMDALLRDSAGAEHTVDLPAARQSLQGIVRTLYAKWGNDLQWLNAPADAMPDRAKMCDMTIDLYRAILALPTKQSANVLRMMLGANAG